MSLRKWLLGIGLLATVVASVGDWPSEEVASLPPKRAPSPASVETAAVLAGTPRIPLPPASESIDGSRFASVQGQLFAIPSWRLAPPPVSRALLPPPLPALPFGYLGKLMTGSEPQFFLSLGSNTVLMRAGDVQEGYRLESTTPSALVFMHLASQQTQRMSIGSSN